MSKTKLVNDENSHQLATNRKRMGDVLERFNLTMQHALRANFLRDLEARAKEEAGILPPLSPLEMWDYLADTDPEFYNWMFPYSTVFLTKDSLSPIHHHILDEVRFELQSENVSEYAGQ